MVFQGHNFSLIAVTFMKSNCSRPDSGVTLYCRQIKVEMIESDREITTDHHITFYINQHYNNTEIATTISYQLSCNCMRKIILY